MNNLVRILIYSIFLILSVTFPQTVLAQKKITLQENNISIKEILKRIEKETDYSAAYNRSKLKLDKTVSVSIKNLSIEKALENIFKDTDYEYKIKGYHIIITYNEKPKEEPEVKVIPPPYALQIQQDKVEDIPINTPKPILAETEVYPVEVPPWEPEEEGPSLMIKNNIAHEALGIINGSIALNLEGELRLSDRYTLNLLVGATPSSIGNDKKMNHIFIQPEIRYWLDKPFSKHFIGLHGHWASFNIENTTLPKLEDNYKGWLAGQGISYGYRWHLSTRWSVEGTLGLGYAYINYKQYDYNSGEFIKKGQKHYVGLTRAGISISYTIK